MSLHSAIPRILMVSPGASPAHMQADIDLLGRYCDLDVVADNRGSKRLVLSVLHRLTLERPDVLLLWGVVPGYLLLLTLFARVLGARVALLPKPYEGGRTAFRVRKRSLASRVRRLDRVFVDAEISTGDLSSRQPGEKALARLLVDLVPRYSNGSGRLPARLVRLDLGCGSLQRPGCVGIDARQTRATAIVADAQKLPIAESVADIVYASCLLEHFDSPAIVLAEVHRALKPLGQAVFRLPNLGTYSSHLDTTHRFLADLALWRSLFTGYFARVEVRPVGTKYRDSLSLVAVNWLLVNVLRWHELAQGWDFICSEPRPEPVLSYIGWWEESEHEGRVAGPLIGSEL